MKLQAQKFRGIIVSTWRRSTPRSKPRIGISTEVDRYIQLTEDELQWVVHEAGPRALQALEEERSV